MKKFSKLLISLAFCLILAFSGLLAGCGGDSDPTEGGPSEGETPTPVAEYTVSVEGGTLQDGQTSGTYDSGTSVTVTANIPAGYSFCCWTSDGEQISQSNPYTFTVTQSIALKAVFWENGSPVSLSKSLGNPITGFGFGDSTFDSSWDTSDTPWQEGEKDFPVYNGDPSVLVDGDTVYLYVGHDATKEPVTGIYTMPEWMCYSSKDLVNWKAESIIMDMESVPWAADDTSAWAAQVIRYEGYYWFLFCTWASRDILPNENENMCIGLAVSESPTGPFECYDTPLVYSSWTNTPANMSDVPALEDYNDAGWNDIDPTGWVTEDGEFYVAWGNTKSFMCQVEMVEKQNNTSCPYELEIVDQDETRTQGHIVTTDKPSYYYYGADNVEAYADIMRIDLSSSNPNGATFTEAPYIYGRDLNGDGKIDRFYMAYAAGMREALAYSYIDVTDESQLFEDEWQYGNLLMEPTATSNTNHPAMFDFKGKTYFVYHNGSLEYGYGYRRIACITEAAFDEDGFIEFIPETATGLRGVRSTIYSGDLPVSHLNFLNPQLDVAYPLEIETCLWAEEDLDDKNDMYWMLTEGKYIPDGEAEEYYLSIQAENKPGLYLTYDIASGRVYIGQDYAQTGTEESVAVKKNMTFKTISVGYGKGVMFQCAADPTYYLANVNGTLTVTNSVSEEKCAFRVYTETANRFSGPTQFVLNEGI